MVLCFTKNIHNADRCVLFDSCSGLTSVAMVYSPFARICSPVGSLLLRDFGADRSGGFVSLTNFTTLKYRRRSKVQNLTTKYFI